MKCSKCGNEYEGNFCPECGTPAAQTLPVQNTPLPPAQPPKKKSGCLKIVLIVLGIFVALGVIGSIFGSDEPASPSSVVSSTSAATSKDQSSSTPASVPAVEDDSIPTEYKSALKKAESYSQLMHMSKAAIYDQLVSEYGEQFSEEAAQYAMDNLVADWNANALAKAESYSETMHMSKAGIYDQLTSEYGEQFTAEEAQYAVDNLDADYFANALEKAKSYQELMDMSPEAIRDQLTSEYGEQFTQEEADYAVSNLK